MTKLDVITIGRSSVDLYGSQIGGRLEDMGSFDKYIGGSPTNIACGTARLGLKRLISRVGDEHMGRFILEQLAREGVETRGVVTDPERLTALVLLGIRDRERFPLIFYRENCADMALCEDDIDPAFDRSARAVVVTGTHLSHPRTEAAVLKALRIAQDAGLKDRARHRLPSEPLGRGGSRRGREPLVASEKVTAKLQSSLHFFDLIGTEEEFHIAGGSATPWPRCERCGRSRGRRSSASAGRSGRSPSQATSRDASTPARPAPASRSRSSTSSAPVTASCRALKGWLDGEDWPTALKYANACGAFAVSRHGCTPAYPSWEELQFFFERGIVRKDLRNDTELEQVHWATNRHGDWSEMRVRLRPPRATRATARRVARADRRLQAPLPRGGAQGSGRSAWLRHPL